MSDAVIFRRALTTSLLNPKAYIFMLAIFPQFLRPGQGPLWVQSGVLAGITALTAGRLRCAGLRCQRHQRLIRGAPGGRRRSGADHGPVADHPAMRSGSQP